MTPKQQALSTCHRCIRAAGITCGGTCPCPADGADITEHAEAGYCPRVEGPLFGDGRVPLTWKSRGIGDVIGKITGAVGIVPCSGCKKRQAAMNNAIAFIAARESEG